MRLITTFELTTRHITELHVLFRIATEHSAKKGGDTNAASTLANIREAIAARPPKP